MRYLKYIGITSLLTVLIACQMNTQSLNEIAENSVTIQSIADVYNVHWRLTAAVSDSGTIDLSTYLPITLVFADGDSLFGVSGCSFIHGNYNFNTSQITFSNVVQTELACRQPTLDMAALLSGSWAVSFTDTSLTLTRASQRLTFVSHYTLPVADFPVTQGTWTLVASNFSRYDEVDQVAFQLHLNTNRALSIEWASLTDSTFTNRVKGYFNRGTTNRAFIRWWEWSYNGFRNFPVPPADMTLVDELENVTTYKLLENNTIFELQTDSGVYFRFQKN